MTNGVFDFRTELYRRRLPIYVVAGQVGLHPSRLSLYLNHHLPMPLQLAQRLHAILREYPCDESLWAGTRPADAYPVVCSPPTRSGPWPDNRQIDPRSRSRSG